MTVAKTILAKNFVVLLLGWTLTEGTLSIVGGIESSLNSDNGLGTVSLSIVRASQILGCLLVNFVLKLLGSKWSAVLGSALCVPFVAIHFYPVWATMIPTAVLQGIGNSFFGVSRCVYLTKIAEEWEKHSQTKRTSLIICFIAIFDSLFYLLLMFMNVGSSFALGRMSLSPQSMVFNVSEEVTQLCGYYYCNEDLGTTFHPGQNDDHIYTSNVTMSRQLPKSSVYRFVTICLVTIILGCIVMAVLLDPLKKMLLLKLKDTINDDVSPTELMKEAISYLKKPNMLLLLLMPIYSNTEASFYMADFSKAFSVCAYGMQYIGLTTASVDLTAPIATFISGFFSSPSLRPIPFVAIFLISGSVIISMIFSRTWIDKFPVMMAISGIWGISRGTLNSRVFAIFGVIFPEKPEVAYTACSLVFGIAGSVFFAIDHLVCVRNKIIALLCLLILASIAYTAVELNVRKKQSMMVSQLSDNDQYDETPSPVSFTSQ